MTQELLYPSVTLPDPLMRSDARLDAAAAAHDADPLGRRGAHLTEYSFRFDTAAVREDDAVDVSPETPARTWTLGDTLDEIRRRGATLNLGSAGLRLAHAHRLPELARAVATHAQALTTWVRLGLDRETPGAAAVSGLRRVPFGATEWDEATRLRAAWFVRMFRAPGGRIVLRPGVAITDYETFRASVAGRLAAGPASAGADGLRADLSDLYAQFGATERAVVAAPRRARAA